MAIWPFSMLAVQVLGGLCWVAQAVADGKIYCKKNQGTLVCLAGS